MKNILITEEQLRQIRESQLLTEGKVLLDNFSKIANLLTFTSPDDFYYVQIIKRFKDNPNDNKNSGNYHAGAWYLGGMRIHSAQELLGNKNAIQSICDANNARAYITINSRSDKETDNFIPIYKQRYSPNDARFKYADQIVPCQPKFGKNFPTRLRYFADIDEPKNAFILQSRARFVRTGTDKHADIVDIDVNGTKIKGKLINHCNALYAYPKNAQEEALIRNNFTCLNVWDETHNIFQQDNVPILDEYVTASGGLHIIGEDFTVPQFSQLKKDLMIFDRNVDMDKLATVHLNIDGKLILYSNVNTKGY